MAELINTLVVPETDILTLKETLYEQQKLLQQLHTDLDVERDASSTAASEALSMILRLQGEKSSLMMEASQYKRMAEEKICHAEEALAIFEDLIYQREMEIASLEFQVQAYQCRLLSMGCNDLGIYETKLPENHLKDRNDTFSGEKGTCNNAKRSTVDRRRSSTPAPDSIDPQGNLNEEIIESEKKSESPVYGDINFYWEQIKKLDERVKEISNDKNSCKNRTAVWKVGTWSPSSFSQASTGSSVNTVKGGSNTSGQVHVHQNFPARDSDVSLSSSSVQDIFEVPKPIDGLKAREFRKNETPELISEGENRLSKPDVPIEETIESHSSEKSDQVKTLQLQKRHEKKIPKPRDGKSVEQNAATIRRATSNGESRVEHQHLVRRIERLERGKNTARQEITGGGGGEEMKMLKEIREQLTSIQSEMRSWRSNKSVPPDEPSLDPLRNAMLYFWC